MMTIMKGMKITLKKKSPIANNYTVVNTYCTKCGKRMVSKQYPTGWYNKETGSPIHWQYVCCPKIVDKWLSWGHDWYRIDHDGQKVHGYD